MVSSPDCRNNDAPASDAVTCWPRPVRARANSAARMPRAARAAVPTSWTGATDATGSSAPPWASIMPLRACMTGSKPGRGGGERPGAPVGGEGAADEPGKGGGEPPVAKPEPGHALGPQVVDQDVGVGGEAEQRGALVRLAQVERGGPLALVDRRVRGRIHAVRVALSRL